MQPDHLPATDTCPHCNMSAIIASVNFLRNRKELFDIVAFLQHWVRATARWPNLDGNRSIEFSACPVLPIAAKKYGQQTIGTVGAPTRPSAGSVKYLRVIAAVPCPAMHKPEGHLEGLSAGLYRTVETFVPGVSTH